LAALLLATIVFAAVLSLKTWKVRHRKMTTADIMQVDKVERSQAPSLPANELQASKVAVADQEIRAALIRRDYDSLFGLLIVVVTGLTAAVAGALIW
jgi:cytochrome oxidase assembly protein ShyY1